MPKEGVINWIADQRLFTNMHSDYQEYLGVGLSMPCDTKLSTFEYESIIKLMDYILNDNL